MSAHASPYFLPDLLSLGSGTVRPGVLDLKQPRVTATQVESGVPRPLPIIRRAFFVAGIGVFLFIGVALLWAAWMPGDTSNIDIDRTRPMDAEDR
jgi:hypothetical protein